MLPSFWVVKLVENCSRCYGCASLVRGRAEESKIPLHMAMMLILPEMMWQQAVSNLSPRSLVDGWCECCPRCCGHVFSHPRSG
ncbi:hypothetical protein Nepgr_002802 [Nepenthes gracilis]|uniref:Uncharacterized protein n=1 Tax=Nepenthes gracilis TaxID=150966 RepID=A0AAD3RYG5_NEPGR|nr:hypothetical protein Nepgr_002802 [Nepenthes gracilis]